MTSRTIRTEEDRRSAKQWLDTRKLPFVMTLEAGAGRSQDQNRLAFLWYREIAEQRGDMTPGEVRAESKLVFGVPILREGNEAFRKTYDRILKPLPYETKLELIRVTELPITRLMNIGQMDAYLNEVEKHFRAQGIVLTVPVN